MFVTCMCDYRRGMDWRMDLLDSYLHDSELRVQSLTVLSLFYKLKRTLSSPVVAW
jgi:hypothetical protein